MKAIVFDTGPVISLTMNNLLWIIERLRERFQGDFYITEAVKIELVDKPLTTKKFKLEAIQVSQLIRNGTFKVLGDYETRSLTMSLLDLAGKFYKAHDNYINVVHYGEMSSVAAAISMKADALVLDERTTRELMEAPKHLAQHLQSKLHTNVDVDEQSVRLFRQEVKEVNVIRSFELGTRAYELGLFSSFIPNQREWKRKLLEGILWAVKLNGCAVTNEEIAAVIRVEKA